MFFFMRRLFFLIFIFLGFFLGGFFMSFGGVKMLILMVSLLSFLGWIGGKCGLLIVVYIVVFIVVLMSGYIGSGKLMYFFSVIWGGMLCLLRVMKMFIFF